MPWQITPQGTDGSTRAPRHIHSKDHRGIVFADQVQRTIEVVDQEARIDSTRTPATLQTLISYMTLWDTLVRAGNKLDSRELSAEEQFLSAENVLKFVEFDAGLSSRGDDFAIGFALAGEPRDILYSWLENEQPGMWSIGFDHDEIKSKAPIEGRAALVRLCNCLTMPHTDAPLQDILEFRERRRPELLNLRARIEKIYQRVASAADGELAIESELRLLESAMADHLRVSQESGLKLRLLDLECRLKVEIDLPYGAIAGFAATAAGLSTLATVLVSAVASAKPKIELANGANLTLSASKANALEFVTRAQTEVPRY